MQQLALAFLLSACLLFLTPLKAQTDQYGEDAIPSYRIIGSVGVNYQKHFLVDFNLLYGQESIHSGFGLRGWRLGTELAIDNSEWLIGPKLGYELTVLIFTIRPNTVYYFYQGKQDWRLMPEVGVSFFSLLNLTYGYAQPLLNTEFDLIGRHRLGLSINLNRKLWKEALR